MLEIYGTILLLLQSILIGELLSRLGLVLIGYLCYINLLRVYHARTSLFRPRSPKDLHYILAKVNTCGTNIPTYYTTRMQGQEMVGLRSSNMAEFEDTYKGMFPNW